MLSKPAMPSVEGIENIVSRMDEGVLCDEHGKPYPELGQMLFRMLWDECLKKLAGQRVIEKAVVEFVTEYRQGRRARRD
jgi:hypothetical protein